MKNNLTRSSLGIMILNSENILKNEQRSDDLIKLISYALKQNDFQNNNNIEKGLYLYFLLYFHLKQGNLSQAMEIIQELRSVLEEYEKENIIIFKIKYQYTGLDVFKNVTSNDESGRTDRLTAAYIKVIISILNMNEFLLLEPLGINLINFPYPQNNFTSSACYNMRFTAYDHYSIQEYSKAIELYSLLRLSRFEVSNTLVHMARPILCMDNPKLANFLINNSWKYHESASSYVVARILWFRILFAFMGLDNNNGLNNVIFELKKLLTGNLNATMSWTMEPVFEYLENKLDEKVFEFMSDLVSAMSSYTDREIIKLNKYQYWRNKI